METENPTRKLKIFCPTHQSVFEIDEKPQIACEIREHALSNNFPYAEFWEYCCDCQTFSPSKFGTGGKVQNFCPHCERPTARRFLCDGCKVVALDSDEETKGKLFAVSAENGSEPTCAGCLKSFAGAKIYQHDCTDIEGALLTNRQDCPFCQKSVINQPAPPKQVEPLPVAGATIKLGNKIDSTQCTKCGHWGNAARAVCGKCGAQVGSLGAGVAVGSAVPKTQLLGSICPNCGTGNDADSVFCVNCGQALKAVPQMHNETETPTVVNPRFPSNVPPIVVNPANTFSAGQSAAAPNFPPKNTSSDSKAPLFVILGAVAFLIVVGLLAYNSKKANSDNYTTVSLTPSSSRRTNTPTPYKSNSPSPLVGRYGYLNTNAYIRSSPGKENEVRGTHYQNAQLKILEVSSFYNANNEYVTWYRIEIIEDGYDIENNRGKGNNWERYGNFGWMEAETEGWIYSGSINLN